MGMDSLTADTKFIRTLEVAELKLLKKISLAGIARTGSVTSLSTLKLTNQINLQTSMHASDSLTQELFSTENPK